MIEYRIDRDRAVICVTVSGRVTLAEVEDYWRRVQAEPDHDAALALLVDIQDASLSDLHPNALRAISAGLLQQPGARLAYVVAGDMQFGIVRMLDAFGGMVQPGREVRPFRDPEAALA